MIAAWAHLGEPLAPHEVWRGWDATPAEVVLLLMPALWYAAGLGALWRTAGVGRGISRARAGAFAAGMLTLVAALVSPLDAMADALFSAHMVQHLLLILVAAPLLVCGAPELPMLWAFPPGRRRALGGWWRHVVHLRAAVHALTAPGTAFTLQLVALWFWHMPAPYTAALRSPGVHALEHLSFLGTAMLFWWVVASPMGRPRAGEGAGILMLVGTLMHSGALGALLIFAGRAWYPVHGAGPQRWGMTALEDQQLAGLIMWVPASIVYVAAAARLFLRWMRRDERANVSRSPTFATMRFEEAS